MATTTKAIPTLSDKGFITTLPETVDYILAYFFETDALQNYLYSNSNTCFAGILSQYPTDMIGLQSALQTALEVMFNRYTDNTVLDISIVPNTSGDTAGSMNIRIGIQVTQGDQVYSANKLISLVNSKFISLTDYINTGV